MGMLDRTRPYGQVVGCGGHVYEQDGKCFDGSGNEIKTEPEVVPEPEVLPEKPAKKARKKRKKTAKK